MRANRVLLAAALLALAASAGATDIVSVFEVRGGEAFVDSLFLYTGGTRPEVVTLDEFGGPAGTIDTAAFGAASWPRMITVHWRLDGREQRGFPISDPVSDSWYDLPPPGDDELPRIKFINLGAVAEPETRPVLARISAWPNPFAGRTLLSVRLARPGRALVEVYDATGRPVRVLADAELQPGRYDWTWDGTDDAGNRLAPGIYLARLATGDESCIRKLVLTD